MKESTENEESVWPKAQGRGGWIPFPCVFWVGWERSSRELPWLFLCSWVEELARVMQHTPDKSLAQLYEARNIKCLKLFSSYKTKQNEPLLLIKNILCSHTETKAPLNESYSHISSEKLSKF